MPVLKFFGKVAVTLSMILSTHNHFFIYLFHSFFKLTTYCNTSFDVLIVCSLAIC